MHNMKLKAYPSHLIKIDEGALISRGITKFKVIGENAYFAIKKILQLANISINKNELLSQFDATETSAIETLVSALLKRNILYHVTETSINERITAENPEDIFYWHFNTTHSKRKLLSDIKLLLAGVNAISKHFLYALKLSGFQNITLIDDPALYDSTLLFDKDQKICSLYDFLETSQENYDCIIAATDTNSTHALSFWNKISLERNWPYFPLALNNIYGYIGLYTIPNVTPCFECLVTRENANLSSPELTRTSNETFLDTFSTNGFHPVMPMILAGLACMELVKIFTETYTQNSGRLITINFITQKMQSHKVLRVPHCKSCSSTPYA